MNTMIRSARRLPALFFISLGLLTASLAQAAQPQLVGPRNTIARVQARTAPSHIEQLRASSDDASVCTKIKVKHYGHPEKGLDRIERSDFPCGKSRLSAR